jgi:hypothetical protein
MLKAVVVGGLPAVAAADHGDEIVQPAPDLLAIADALESVAPASKALSSRCNLAVEHALVVLLGELRLFVRCLYRS